MHGRFLQTIYFSASTVLVFLKANLFNINRNFAFSRVDARDSGNNAEIWLFYLIKSIFLNQILLNSVLGILDIVYSKSIFQHLKFY